MKKSAVRLVCVRERERETERERERGRETSLPSSSQVHLPSLTVFSNWPALASLGCVSALDLSPQSHYLALGNVRGQVPLYRLNHYT